MSDKNTIIQDLEVIHVKLNQLVAAYNELKTLDDTDAHEETLREGFLLKAGKNTEKILKYICKKEGILVTAKPQNGKSVDTRIPMLNDYIFHLKEKKIINEDIHHHLEIIKKWRNRSAHDLSEDTFTVDTIKDSTIESVNDSFNYIKDWFFIKYLKGEYADFSKNVYASQEKIKGPSRAKLDEEQRNFDRNPLNISDLSILSQSKKAPITRKKNKWLIYILLLGGAAFLGYYVYSEYSGNRENTNTIKSNTHLNKNQVLSTIRKYYDSYYDLKFDAHNYFANYVDHYITDPNINNPTEIEIARKTNMEYIDPRSTIDSLSLVMVSKNDSISYWQFSGENVCYRTSKKKFQKCNILMEYGINTEGKITRIKQIRYWNAHYYKTRPN